jgi:FMN-dependent NADH-azoreductase
MYNFGIASTLKTWFDYVLRAAITFKYTESGAVGLLEGKRAIVIETRGGLYSEGPAQMMDSQEPHLRHLLSFMGITNVKFFRAELSLPSIGRPTPARSVRRGACAIHRRRVDRPRRCCRALREECQSRPAQ